MNLKKFISGVSAFAIAASAFAAMAVNASAEDKGPVSVIARAQKHNVEWSAGIATAGTLASGEYAAAKIDFDDLEGISSATSVKLNFDTYVKSGDMVLYSVGDKSKRTVVDNSGNYKTAGAAMYFGSTTGSNYGAYDVKGAKYAFTISSGAIGTWVSAEFTFNTATKKCSYKIGPKTGEIDTDLDNLTTLDCYTNKSGGQFGIKNVTVSYTVPDAPAPVSVDLDVTNQKAFTGTGDSKAVIVNSAISGVDTIDTLTITADGTEKTFANGTDFNFSTNFGGSDAVIAVIVNNVSEVTAIAIN